MHLKILALAAACACTLLPSALADPGVVPPPTAAWATAGPDGVTIHWEAPVVDGIAVGYVVYREGQAIASVTGTHYFDAGGNSTNVYQVESFDAEGHHSPPAAATMLSSPCDMLLDLAHFPFLFVDPLKCLSASLQTGGNMVRTLHDPPILDD